MVVEVASESTYRADLDVDKGKGWSYAQARVGEYLVLDPSGQFVPELGRGWRLENGVYRPWAVDASSSLEFSPGVKDHERVRAYVEAAR